MLPSHICYVDFRSPLMHMLCINTYCKASVKICNRNSPDSPNLESFSSHAIVTIVLSYDFLMTGCHYYCDF